ncbi:hypothetical protein TWF281_003239 [Arthrobotrys megalospora]
MEGKKIDLKEAYKNLIDIFPLKESQRVDPKSQTITWKPILESQKQDVYQIYHAALGEPSIAGTDPFYPIADIFMSQKAYDYWVKSVPGGTYADSFGIHDICDGTDFTIEVGWKNKANTTFNDLKQGTFVVFHEKNRRGDIYQYRFYPTAAESKMFSIA